MNYRVSQQYKATSSLQTIDLVVTFRSTARWAWLARHKCTQQARYWRRRAEHHWHIKLSLELQRTTVANA